MLKKKKVFFWGFWILLLRVREEGSWCCFESWTAQVGIHALAKPVCLFLVKRTWKRFRLKSFFIFVLNLLGQADNKKASLKKVLKGLFSFRSPHLSSYLSSVSQICSSSDQSRLARCNNSKLLLDASCEWKKYTTFFPQCLETSSQSMHV